MCLSWWLPCCQLIVLLEYCFEQGYWHLCLLPCSLIVFHLWSHLCFYLHLFCCWMLASTNMVLRNLSRRFRLYFVFPFPWDLETYCLLFVKGFCVNIAFLVSLHLLACSFVILMDYWKYYLDPRNTDNNFGSEDNYFTIY